MDTPATGRSGPHRTVRDIIASMRSGDIPPHRMRKLATPVTIFSVTPVPWRMAEKYTVMQGLSEIVRMGREYALQGELVGPGVNGNRYLLKNAEEGAPQ